jgi:hypothetical protein
VRRGGGQYALGFRCFILGATPRATATCARRSCPTWSPCATQPARPSRSRARELACRVPRTGPVRTTGRVHEVPRRRGPACPLHGLGKALLAFHPPEEVAAHYRVAGLPRFTPSTVTDVDALLAELDAIRRRGYATDEQEREIDVRCVAAPVRDHHGEVVAAITVAGPGERLPRPLVGSHTAEQVVTCAGAISNHLGYSYRVQKLVRKR